MLIYNGPVGSLQTTPQKDLENSVSEYNKQKTNFDALVEPDPDLEKQKTTDYVKAFRDLTTAFTQVLEFYLNDPTRSVDLKNIAKEAEDLLEKLDKMISPTFYNKLSDTKKGGLNQINTSLRVGLLKQILKMINTAPDPTPTPTPQPPIIIYQQAPPTPTCCEFVKKKIGEAVVGAVNGVGYVVSTVVGYFKG